MALKHEGVHDALLRVVASQADALALTGTDLDVEGGCWTPRGFLKRNTQLTTLSRELSLDELRAHFGKPIVEVAKEFGICTTFLKKICRRCGIKRWPHRQIRSLQRTIQMLHQAEASASTSQERLKFSNQIAQLEAKKRAVIQDPDANGKLKRVKKCGAKNKCRRSGASEKSEDDVDMGASDDDDMDDEDDAMRLLEMAGVHQPATPEAAPKLDAASESAMSPINGGGSLDVPLEPIIIAETGGASRAATGSPSPTPPSATIKTPTASSKSKCSSPDENGVSSTSEPSGLKISPSNRKISLGAKKYDIAADSQRVRSSSLGSLQDKDEQPEADLVATEVSST